MPPEADTADVTEIESTGIDPVAGEGGAPEPPSPGDNLPSKTPDFYEAELRRARDEAAESRIKAKRFVEAFDGYEDSHIDNYLEMVRLLGSSNPEDNTEARKRFANVVSYLDDQGLVPPDDADGPKYLTADDLKKMKFEEEVARQEAALLATAKSLGYQEGSASYKTLLNVAMEDPSKPLTLEQAHEKIVGQIDEIKKAAVQEYLDGLKSQDRHPPVSGGGAGAVVPGGTIPVSPREAARARMEAAGFKRRG